MGIITKLFAWMGHPAKSDSDIADWVGGLVLILILSFLWSTVVRQTID
jgi:hypothetical protein